MNTAKWLRVTSQKSVRRIPLFVSARVILEQLLEREDLRVIKVAEIRRSYCPERGSEWVSVKVPKVCKVHVPETRTARTTGKPKDITPNETLPKENK